MFRKVEVSAPAPTSAPAPDPLNGYSVGAGYDFVIENHDVICDWSICRICLDLVENKTQNAPDSYWCCPECASEAMEIPYYSLTVFLEKNSVNELQQ